MPGTGEQGAVVVGLVLEGEYWSVTFGGREFRLRDSKGMGYLALLLASPGREFPALELGASDASGGISFADAAGAGLSVSVESDSGPVLDADAKASYRERLTDLQGEIDEAERFNDPERVTSARAEFDAVAAELSAATGLGGRDRRVGSVSERARLNVTRAIDRAIARLAEHDRELSELLEACVQTGRVCVYGPAGGVEWRVSASGQARPALELGGSGRAGAVHTFLFTDIEGSTRRWQAEPDAMPGLLAAHDAVLRTTVEAHRGRVFKHTGDGMCAVFGSVADAVVATVEAQRGLELPVRMGVHTGEAADRGGDFFGLTLNRCARLMDAAHGGQVLVSAGSAALVGHLDAEIELRDLGEHRLRDLAAAERIFQVLAPGLTRDLPALRTLDAVRHNLPVLRSSFVGRDLELIEVSDRLGGGQLVTLTGVGGCGKTRLALEVAAGLTGRFPQGVFFVDLAVLSDPALLGQAVASAMDLQLTDVGIESLAGYLVNRRVLVVLDNCEHLLDACAELVDGLLARCPELRILATSREALGVEGEEVFRVPSLNVETDAVRLFMDRSRAAGAHIQSDDAVTRICQRLDGIPLAIELAAARTTHLSPDQILERLADRFRLLTGGRRRRVQRQQTLSAAIDWSHDLLTDDERSLFRRLAVFRATFSLTAVEAICHPDAVDLLGSLVEKSLVNLHDDGRYRLLETVRVYAEERLVESGEADAIRSAHRDWFLDWVEALPGGQTIIMGAVDVLVPEADNLAGALEWSLEQDRVDLIARIASRMFSYWASYVVLADMEAWWRVLAENLGRLSERDRASALLVGAVSRMMQGDSVAMTELNAKALELAPRDSWIAAFALWIQAAMWVIADPQRGLRYIDEGIQSARAAGEPELEHMFAVVALMELTGDHERDATLRGAQMIDDLLPTIGDRAPVTAFNVLGAAAALGNQQASERLLSQIPTRSPVQRLLHELVGALIARNEGRIEVAGRHLQAATAVVREHAMPLAEASCLIGFSALAAGAGDYERASRDLASLEASRVFPTRLPVDFLVYQVTARAVRGALDTETAARCHAEGAAMSVSEALDAELARLENAGHGSLASPP